MTKLFLYFYYLSDRLASLLLLLHLQVNVTVLEKVEHVLAIMVFIYMICALVWILFRRPKRIQMGKSTSVLADSFTLTWSFFQIIISGILLGIVGYLTLLYKDSAFYLQKLLQALTSATSDRKVMVAGMALAAVFALLFLVCLLIKGIMRLIKVMSESIREYGLLGPVRIYISGFMLIGAAVILLAAPSQAALISFVPIAYLLLTVLAIVMKPRKKTKSGGGLPRINKTTKKKKSRGADEEQEEDESGSRRRGYAEEAEDDSHDDFYAAQNPSRQQEALADRNAYAKQRAAGQRGGRNVSEPDIYADGEEFDDSFIYQMQPEELPDVIYEVGKNERWQRVAYLVNGGCAYRNEKNGEDRYITQVYNQDDHSYWSTNAGNYEQRADSSEE